MKSRAGAPDKSTADSPTAASIERTLLAGAVFLALGLSGISPYDRLTWLLEVSWVIIGLPLTIGMRRRFPLTRLLYWALAIHAFVLIVGGYYTYERVPLGDWCKEAFHLGRNHYDRLGHFLQGFVPAILAREWLLRRSPLRPGWLLFGLVVCVCLAFSAFFEMIEWQAAVALGSGADAYLATQGDPWDTQWDMFLAMCGAAISQLLLARLHDAQLAKLPPDSRR